VRLPFKIGLGQGIRIEIKIYFKQLRFGVKVYFLLFAKKRNRYLANRSPSAPRFTYKKRRRKDRGFLIISFSPYFQPDDAAGG
jgi:hypothetical protein